MLGSQETLFFAGPPAEAHSVVDAELGERERVLEDPDGARAIVVYAWAGLNGVSVCAYHDYVVFVAGFGLGDNVVAISISVNAMWEDEYETCVRISARLTTNEPVKVVLPLRAASMRPSAWDRPTVGA